MRRVLTPLLAAALVAAPALAQNRPTTQGPPAARDSAPPSLFRKFTDLVRGAQLRQGFFDTYEKGDHLYLVIAKDRLGRDFLMEFKIAQGIGANRVFGGLMFRDDAKVVAFERRGDRVFLVERQHLFTAPVGSPAARAVELSFSASVLESAKIESIREDSALVVDVYGWFVGDVSNIGQYVRDAVAQRPGVPGRATLEKERSYLESVKAFPRNLNIRSKLTFRPGEPVTITSVPDSRFIPVSVHHTLAELPAAPMTPRLADDRVGYFLTVQKDFSRDDRSFFVRYANRWRLEPGAPAGDGLVEPKQPIVYYLDRNIPDEYRPYIQAGVEAWNAAFEAAGWKNAIRAELLPDGADAEDLRYPTLRWNTSNEPDYGAIGPSTVDPRTGEILDADILFEASMVLGWKSFWRANIDPVRAVEELFQASPDELAAAAAGAELASMGAELSAQGTLLRAALLARGALGPGDPVPTVYLGEALKRVSMHEVGHTLGLRHNFRSSSDTPFDKLHDRAWAEANGLASSVMEYPGINVAPRGRENGYYYSPGIGSYDRWAIAYGYTADPRRAEALAREAARPGHAYGTDEDARDAGALDPTVNLYDLSDDPMAWGRERADMIRDIWARLPDHVLTDNAAYAEVTNAFQTLLTQYARALATGVKYVGGQYQYRDHAGDPSGRAPFVNVPRTRQLQALAFLTEYAFGEQAFPVPPAVAAKFGADRWRHWGNTNTVAGRIDYPLHEQVAGVQRALLARLMQPFLFARIRDAEQKFGSANVVTIPEMMDRLTHAIWSEVWAAPGRNINAMRRDLQRAYIDQLTVIVATPPDRTPADARAVARQKLVDLNRRIGARLAPPAVSDAYTTAHLEEVRARIGKTLAAGLEVERR